MSLNPEIKSVETVYCCGFDCPYCETLIPVGDNQKLISGKSFCPHCYNKFIIFNDKVIEFNKRRNICQISENLYGKKSDIITQPD
jgi:hypothetical protein